MDFATLVLGAKTDGLKDGERALDSLTKTGQRTEGVIVKGSAAMSAGFKAMALSAAGVLSVAASVQALTASISRIDAMDEAATSIDGTVNALRALELATGEAGISQGDLMATMQAMNRELAKAAEEGGPAADALAKLGLKAADLAALDADARLAAIADAMHGMGLSAGQATAILQDLGVRSKEMSVALMGGGDAIRAARFDVAALGLELNKSGIDAVTRANDAMGRMGLASEALGNQLAVVLSPALEKMASAFVSSLQDGGALRVLIDGIAGSVALAAQALPYLISGVGALGVAYTASLIPALMSGVAWLGTMEGMFIAGAIASRAFAAAVALTPIGLIAAAGAGLYALVSSSNNAASAADIQAEAERGLAEALGKVNGTGTTAIQQRKDLAQASLDEANAAVTSARANLELAQSRAQQLGNTRAGAGASASAAAATAALAASEARLAGIVAKAQELGISLSGLPPVVKTIEQLQAATTQHMMAQYEFAGKMRAESQADASAAQAMLAAQVQKNELARLTLQYGAESAQVANAHRDAELGVVAAQVNQLDVSEAVKQQILQSANAGLILEQAVSAAGGAAGTLASRAGLIAGVLWPAVEAARQLAAALGGAVSQLGGIAAGMARMTAVGRATAAAGGILGKVFNAGAINAASNAFGGAAAKIQSLYTQSVKAAGAGKTLADVLGGTGGGSGGGVAGGAKAAVKELTEAEQAAKKYAETMQGFVTDGIGKAVDWMVNGFKGGLKGMVGLFKSTIQQMIAYALKNKIMVSLGMGGAVGGAGGALAGVAGGGGAAGGGMFSGIISKVGGVFSSFLSGASGLVSSLFGAGGGLGAAGTYLSSVLGGATASLGGFAAAAGAIALPISAIAGLFSFFKTKTKELDSGLKVTVNGLDTLVETFRTVQKTKFWGLSKKVSTTTVAASDDLADPIQAAYLSIRKNVVGMASALGIGTEKLKGFTASISLSTAGMSQEQAQEAVLKSLGVLGDKLSTAITGGVKSLSKAGETAMETLTRLSTSLTTANDAMKALGYDLFRVGFRGAAAASAMVDLYGGLDKFASVTDYYFQNFYSLAERTKYLASQFGASVGAITSARVPQTAEQFRALIERLQEAGRLSAVAELMKLAPMFTQLLQLREELKGVGDTSEITGEDLSKLQSILEERKGLEEQLLALQGNTAELRRRELAALDPSNQALQKLIWGLEDMATAADKAKGISDERKGLEEQLLALRGNTAELRRRELAALDPSNQALQKMIWALEDAATAADKASAISDQRKGLEEQLLELQGNTAELRRRELAALDPTNRALQTMIWGLEDAKKAIDALDPNNFASLFDFNLATARANRAAYTPPTTTGILPGPGPAYNAPRAVKAGDDPVVIELRALKAQMATMQAEANARATETANATKSTAKTMNLWEGRGMPPVAV